MRKALILLFLIVLSAGLRAQELDCRVIVNSERAQTTERDIFRDMEKAFAQFLNERQWTNDAFEPREKIKCQLIIGIDAVNSATSFSATVQVQSVRPVFNTNLETSLLSLTQNYADKDWQFEYSESQPLDFNENIFSSNITSILAYYAYMIIGLDYDSFSRLGGNPYFEKAMQIAMTAQQSNRTGWQQFVSPPRNRYWLIENMMNPQLRPVREAVYEYHRLSLDLFLDDADESRKVALEALKKIQKANSTRPNSFLVTLFFYSKSSEISNLFSEGDLGIRREAYTLLTELDPTNTDKYRKIIQS